ncbi:mapk-regulated corepressor-interacting protein 1 isoform X2 [Callithrix jacchus]|uniref:mapk-regulated corepressor-interacting protein 1 isoform X1 n=1 Tax=Callithrix jacchus TaxID=9483 RepID=UPI00159E92F0|nr:mapk-regulated corepressor-interacting protein 1 isoform X1 [Callithrix jacchus]
MFFLGMWLCREKNLGLGGQRLGFCPLPIRKSLKPLRPLEEKGYTLFYPVRPPLTFTWAAEQRVRILPAPGPLPQRLRGSGGGALGSDAPAMTSSPVSRVVYNGKRTSSPRSPPSSSEIFTPAHEENVRFIYEAWQGVERDLRSQVPGGERGLVEEYVEKVPNPSLKTFKPIDLSDLKRRSTQDAKKS